MSPLVARVVVLAGPSGSGKSRLSERLAMPVLHLDDYYRSGGDPALPRLPDAAVDWDHPDSWLHDEALEALEQLCRTGRAEVPVYDIAQDGRVGHRPLDLAGAPLLLTEGLFAAEVVEECRARGLLADAVCLTQHPARTFWRRLTRDLREHRKPPLVLVRRGLRLMREQRSVVQHAVDRGCRVASPHTAYAEIRALGRRP